MPSYTHSHKSVWPYVILVFVFSVPFFVLGPLLEQFLPELAINLPASALTVVVPIAVATYLTWREGGWASARRLLGRAFDAQKISPVWWLPIIFIMPLAMVLHYLISQRIGSIPPPEIALLPAMVMFVFFFIGAIAEEIGWQGYAYDRLTGRMPALAAALVLGLIWVTWHIVPFIQTGHDTQWIIWQCVFSLWLRVLIVWVYVNNRRSVLAAVLLHTMSNLAVFLFPIYGSYYDPMIASAIMAVIGALVVALWGGRTLMGSPRQ